MFDRWYASGKLIRWIRRQGWHVICALTSNRKLDGVRVDEWDQRLKHRRYTRVPCDVCVLISKRHPRDKHPKYLLCTDLTLTAQTVLTWYNLRWPLEVDYRYLKQVLGLGDFRMQPYEAIEKWYAVVYLVLTFLQWRLYEARALGEPWGSLAEVIRQHRAEHARPADRRL